MGVFEAIRGGSFITGFTSSQDRLAEYLETRARAPAAKLLGKPRSSVRACPIYDAAGVPSIDRSTRTRRSGACCARGTSSRSPFFASLGDQFSFAELSGASLLAGTSVLVAAVSGLPVTLPRGSQRRSSRAHRWGRHAVRCGDLLGLSTVDERGAAVAARVPAMVGLTRVTTQHSGWGKRR